MTDGNRFFPRPLRSGLDAVASRNDDQRIVADRKADGFFAFIIDITGRIDKIDLFIFPFHRRQMAITAHRPPAFFRIKIQCRRAVARFPEALQLMRVKLTGLNDARFAGAVISQYRNVANLICKVIFHGMLLTYFESTLSFLSIIRLCRES